MLELQMVLQQEGRRQGEVKRNREGNRWRREAVLSEEGDVAAWLGIAEPAVRYSSSLPDTLTCRAGIVWESGICNPCGQSLFSAPKITFPGQNNVLSYERSWHQSVGDALCDHS